MKRIEKPTVLIVDRSPLAGRILEELLRPLAEVKVRSNVWSAIRLLDSERTRLKAIFVERHVLLSSSLADHWRERHGRRNGLRVFVLVDDNADLGRHDFKGFRIDGYLQKPYDRRCLPSLEP